MYLEVREFDADWREATVWDDDDDVDDDDVTALNPCEYNNAGCEQLCIRVTPTTPGQLGYRCNCQSGILAPDNHTCVSSSESQTMI